MVLLVLAGIWAAVLIPPAVRARAEGRPGDSIHNFKRQLSVLRRTGPHRGAPGGPGRADGGDRYRHLSSQATLSPVRGPVGGRSYPTAGHRASSPSARLASPAATAARSRTIRRRRDVLTALLVAAVATLALGLLLGMGVMLVAHVVTDILLVGYVALLVHQRNVAAEREMKVRFLPQAQRIDPALLRAEPALLRRSAN